MISQAILFAVETAMIHHIGVRGSAMQLALLRSGAGLMLVPIYLGLCRAASLDRGHEAAGALINANLGMAVLVSLVHSVTMIAAGGCVAWLVYRYLGLKFVSRSWFNLDATWAFSFILVGALSLSISLASRVPAH